MKLYGCWGTFPVHGHADLPPGARARTRASTSGECPASFRAPKVLVLDNGEVIKDSKNIVARARENPQV